MNFQQLEYLLAVAEHQHFGRAAKQCHVTQPTLSMMIQKLEREMDVVLFDRSKHPTVLTAIGEKLVEQARTIKQETLRFKEICANDKLEPTGELNLGIIPTLAPYLLPRFLKSFLDQHPKILLRVFETTTDRLVEQLQQGKIDVAILVTPLQNKSIIETPLFYEEFYLYTSEKSEKRYVLPNDINPEKLWLLEEGHCFRSQILNLCELRRASSAHVEYYAGSLETLIQLVRRNSGMTVLPELAVLDLPQKDLQNLVRFAPPAPTREVSLAQHRNQLKKRLIELLKDCILACLPDNLSEKNNKGTVIPIKSILN